jgi:hypothetical protein
MYHELFGTLSHNRSEWQYDDSSVPDWAVWLGGPGMSQLEYVHRGGQRV